jgi:DNA-directed RNA polymerase subunit M/transcription elongation factor TFIIS
MISDANEPLTYQRAVRTFDHAALAGLEAYPKLREALNEIAKTADNVNLAYLLTAVQDMVLTTPYADTCECGQLDATYPPTWPYKVDREDDWLTCSYRCGRCGRTWTCGYSVAVMDWL